MPLDSKILPCKFFKQKFSDKTIIILALLETITVTLEVKNNWPVFIVLFHYHIFYALSILKYLNSYLYTIWQLKVIWVYWSKYHNGQWQIFLDNNYIRYLSTRALLLIYFHWPYSAHFHKSFCTFANFLFYWIEKTGMN